MAGPGISPASMRRLRLMSMKPFMLPPVRIVVTPPARYSRVEALAELAVHAGAGRVIEVLVQHHEAGDDALAGEVEDGRAGRRRDARRVAERGDDAVANDEGLIVARRPRPCRR